MSIQRNIFIGLLLLVSTNAFCEETTPTPEPTPSASVTPAPSPSPSPEPSAEPAATPEPQLQEEMDLIEPAPTPTPINEEELDTLLMDEEKMRTESETLGPALPLSSDATITICEMDYSPPPTNLNRLCTHCPSFTNQPGEADTFDINIAERGHFSSPDENEIFLWMHGCATHEYDGDWTVLIRNIQGNWLTALAAPGQMGKCVKFETANGRNFFVCHRKENTDGLLTEFIEERFISDYGLSINEFFRFYNDAGQSKTNRPLPIIRLDTFSKMDMDSDGEDDLKIVFNVSGLEGNAPNKTYEFHYLFNGDYFVLDSEQNATLAEFKELAAWTSQ